MAVLKWETDDDSPVYNHTLALTLVEYTSAVSSLKCHLSSTILLDEKGTCNTCDFISSLIRSEFMLITNVHQMGESKSLFMCAGIYV